MSRTPPKPGKHASPRQSTEDAVFLNLLRTADTLLRGVDELLKPSGLSSTQYNVLRILRGAGPGGLTCGEIAERMLTRDPDVTRLLDRVENRGFISRWRDDNDRRVVRTIITTAALDLLKELNPSVNDLHHRQLGHLGEQQLKDLSALLQLARRAPG